MDVSRNHGTPKSSILIGFSIINHPFWGTPIFGNIQIVSIRGYYGILKIRVYVEHRKNPRVLVRPQGASGRLACSNR